MENQGEYMRQAKMTSDMSMDDHMQMMEQRRIATLWCHFVNMILGAWVISSPFVHGYLIFDLNDLDLLRLAQERELPDIATRNLLMTWSDILSGALVVVFSLLALKRHGWAQWANATMGCWLMFAPLIFWSPSPAAYTTGLFAGGFLIAFSVLVPMMPGMSMQGMMQKASLPPGWDYNPSTWLQRMPIAMLAVLGILLARYLAAFQLGHINSVWDPFFGTQPNGTETIISSEMSKAWPVSDAGIGVSAYMLELLMAVMGDARRWRNLMGSLIITISVLAMAEVTRTLRLLNVFIGLWLMAAPWLLSGGSLGANIGGVLVGLVVIALSIPKGSIRYRYAGWNQLIW